MKKPERKYQKLPQKKMQNKLNKIAKETNLFLKKFINKQKKSNLIIPMNYGLFSGGKKIRSKILTDVGSLFKLDYKSLIIIGSAVECIHAYSLIHDDLPRQIFSIATTGHHAFSHERRILMSGIAN